MNPRRLARPTQRISRGVSLVEVLVALVVLSVGMLGIAAMFVESVRNSRTALLRTQAINLVGDMADRIRANASARGAYDLARGAATPAAHDCAPSRTSVGANCTIGDLAEDDLARWTESVNGALPASGGDAPLREVLYLAPANPGEPERYSITVSWKEPGEADPLSYRSDVLIMPRPPPS